ERNDSHQNILNHHQKKIQELEKEKNELTKKHENLTTLHEKTTQELEKLNSELKQKEITSKILEKDFFDACQSIDSLTEALKEEREENDRLEQEIEKQTSD